MYIKSDLTEIMAFVSYLPVAFAIFFTATVKHTDKYEALAFLEQNIPLFATRDLLLIKIAATVILGSTIVRNSVSSRHKSVTVDSRHVPECS